MSMLSRTLLEKMGFASLGENVLISEHASIYGASRISIGSNVRIDDFSILSAGDGGISIGNYVHIAAYSSLVGAGEIIMSDFSGLSSRVSIYSSSDDYSGNSLTNPTVPNIYTKVLHADVFVGRHVIIGSGSVVLPGTRLEDGVAIGALSLVNKNCLAFGIYAGTPVKKIGDRETKILDLENALLRNANGKI